MLTTTVTKTYRGWTILVIGDGIEVPVASYSMQVMADTLKDHIDEFIGNRGISVTVKSILEFIYIG